MNNEESRSEQRCLTVREYLNTLQNALCTAFAQADGTTQFSLDAWERSGGVDALAGNGVTAVLEDGTLFERGGVALSDVRGTKLPPAAR